MRNGLTRTGGVLAIGLSGVWALLAAGLTVFGVALLVSGDDTTADDGGLIEFLGGSFAVVGLIVLAGAIGSILLAVRIRRGRNGARVGLGILFALFSLVSASFLASVFADDTGVDPGGVVVFGLNTAICLAVLLSVLIGRPADSVSR